MLRGEAMDTGNVGSSGGRAKRSAPRGQWQTPPNVTASAAPAVTRVPSEDPHQGLADTVAALELDSVDDGSHPGTLSRMPAATGHESTDAAVRLRQLQAEEVRRARRRARNRVSARARRRRQKDVRLALTARLNVLEDAVDALERYEWGANRLDVPRFQKAFSVDVFAPKLPSSASVLAAATVLAELALANVDCIRDCLVDNEAIVLASLACDDDGMPRSVSVGSDLSDVRATTRSPISESGSVLYELQEHLDLNPKQVRQLKLHAAEVASERREMAALDRCAAVLALPSERVSKFGSGLTIPAGDSVDAEFRPGTDREFAWLKFRVLDAVSEPWISVLSADQLAKFVLWTNTNAGAISSLHISQPQSKQGHVVDRSGGGRGPATAADRNEPGWLGGSSMVKSAVRVAEALRSTLARFSDSPSS